MTYDPFRSSLIADLLAKEPSGWPGDLPSVLKPPAAPLAGLLGLAGMTGPSPAWRALNSAPPFSFESDALARALNALSQTPAPSVPMVNRITTPTQYLPPLPPPRPAPRRHAFFSFHYDADINRVNVVRNSWRIRAEDQVPGFFDRSLWERTKRTDHSALKRLIRSGLKGTSVTCVLVGAETWSRPWVRYEIAESIRQGNGLLAVDIHELYCIKARSVGWQGYNPLDFMGAYRADDGLTYVCELWDGSWRRYPLMTDSVPWPAYLYDTGIRNRAHALSGGTGRHPYKSGDGHKNLSAWIAQAATAARRK